MTAATAGAVPADVREAATHGTDPVTVAEGLTLVTERRTNRWHGIVALATVLLGIGAVVASPALVTVAAVGLGYAVYQRMQRPPAPELSLTRTVDEPDPAADDEVAVTLAIENVGSTPAYDVRVIDGVPPALTVTDGAARRATMLRPGQRASLAYTVETPLGHHEFDPATVIVRDVAGTHEHVYEAAAPSQIHAEPTEEPLPPMALRQLAAGMTGRIATDDGGPGVEFHAVREYRPGDPLNRIDWNRRARSGELATVDFRREQMATVVLVIDVRPAANVGPPGTDRPASETCVDAGVSLFFGLLDAGDRVGVTTLGEHPCWLPPGIGLEHREHGRMLFTAHPSLGPRTGGAVSIITEEWALDHRIPTATQLVFLTPMADGGAARYATRFEARGHPVTVLSPDPCGDETPGQVVAGLERQVRLHQLRDRGIRVIDWDPAERSLAAALEVAAAGWST